MVNSLFRWPFSIAMWNCQTSWWLDFPTMGYYNPQQGFFNGSCETYENHSRRNLVLSTWMVPLSLGSAQHSRSRMKWSPKMSISFLPSGKRLHNELERSTMLSIEKKTPISMAIFQARPRNCRIFTSSCTSNVHWIWESMIRMNYIILYNIVYLSTRLYDTYT